MPKICKSLLALLVFNLPGILIGSWGNLEIYIRSYYYYESGYTKEDLNIIPIIFMMMLNISMVLVPVVIHGYYNIYLYVTLSFITSALYMILCNAKMLAEFYMLIMILTLSSRLLISIANYTAADLYPNNRAFVIGFVLSGISISNIIWNFIMTGVINPNNEKVLGNEVFSSEVASRVPLFMTYLGVFSFSCGIIGTLIIDRSLFNKSLDKEAIADSLSESISRILTKKESTSKGVELKEFMIVNQNILSMARTKSETIGIHPRKKTDNTKEEVDIELNNLEQAQNNQNNSNGVFFEKPIDVRNSETIHEIPTNQFRLSLNSFVPNLNSPLSNISMAGKEKQKNHEQVFKNKPEKILEDDEDNLSIDDINIPMNTKIITESKLISEYVNTHVFKVLFVSSFIRNMFSIYLMNNFKNIALININDDHFVSYSSSFAFLLSLGFQMFGGIVVDKIGILNTTLIMYVMHMFVIAIYVFFASSKLAFLIAILIFRMSFGLCMILNNSSLYNVYEKAIATRLLKYYFMNSLTGVIAANLIEKICVTNEDYDIMWIVHTLAIIFGIYYVIRNLEVLDSTK